MAIVLDQQITLATSNTNSLALNLPAAELQQTDDYLLLFAVNDGGGTAHNVAGWTEYDGPAPNNTTRFSVWYIRHTGTDIISATVTGQNDNWSCAVYLIRGADTTTFIHSGIRVNYPTASIPSDHKYSLGSISTTEDNLLVFSAFANDVGRNVTFEDCFGNGFYLNGLDSVVANNCSLSVNYRTEPNQGLVRELFVRQLQLNGAEQATAYTIAINNATGAIVQPTCLAVPKMIENHLTIPTYNQLSAIRTTIAGQTVYAHNTLTFDYDDQISHIDDPIWFGHHIVATVSGGGNEGVYGWYKDIPSTDFTTGNYQINLSYIVTFLFAPEGNGFYFEDSSGNWVVWQKVTEEEADGKFRTYILSLPNQTFIDSSGTIDWTDIVRTGVAVLINTTNATTTRTMGLGVECITNPAVLIGGDSDNPVTFNAMHSSLNQGVSIARSVSLSETARQNLITQSVQIGNGSTPTYFSGNSYSVAIPDAGNGFLVGYFVDDNSIDITVNASANCTIDFRSMILSSFNLQTFSINSASSLSATYLTSNFIIRGFSVEWLTGVTCEQVSFIDCNIIDAKAQVFDRCGVTESRSITSAMVCENGGGITNSSFIKGSETYAIQIDSSGNYTLEGTTFTGYTTDLNVTATTGTISITLNSGQTQPTFTSAGATVTFVQPTTTFIFESLQIGSDVVIKDPSVVSDGSDNNIVQRFEDVTSTTVNWSLPISVPTLVDIEIYKEGYKLRAFRDVPTSNDRTISGDQELDPVFN